MLNFVPNNIIKVVPGDSPWITRSLKNMLNKQNRLFKDKNSDKNRVDNFRKECEMAAKTMNINTKNDDISAMHKNNEDKHKCSARHIKTRVIYCPHTACLLP